MTTVEYRTVIWKVGGDFLFSTGWQSEKDFKRAFQSIYEGFPPEVHTIRVTRRESTSTVMTVENMYRVLWNDEVGRSLDRVQKEVTGDDDIDVGEAQ